VGVDPQAQGTGVGRRMMRALEERLNARHVAAVITQVDWRNHAMLKFLDGAGFQLAPRLVATREVRRMPLPKTDEEIEAIPPLIRHLRADDFEMIERIDRRLTGQDRSEYLRAKFDEVLVESAIAVSLVAEDDGFVVAFAMARVDYGDFGHVQPAATLDTIGVNPGFAHKGMAQALLTQMIDNLSALHVESLETEVSRGSFELLRFLYQFGFGPSQRLAFERRVTPLG
jgi:ribosomal protein S18 acetylase RimI-like enzyme